MFLERYFDAVLNICSQFDVPIWFCLSSHYHLSKVDFDLTGLYHFFDVFSNDVTDVKRHKRQLNFAFRSFFYLIID